MKILRFNIIISAPKEKVWGILWDDKTYRKWSIIFSEGSHVITDWKERSKALFLDSEGEGLFSIIEINIPNEQMIFKHLGVVKNGVEMPANEETLKWSGSLEKYTLKETNGVTTLFVDLDVSEEHEQYFQAAFPNALNTVKSLAEHQINNINVD